MPETLNNNLIGTVHVKEYQIGMIGPDGAFQPAKNMKKEDLLNLVGELHQKLREARVEKDAMVLTMNKFLAKDHGEQLQKVLEHAYETSRTYS